MVLVGPFINISKIVGPFINISKIIFLYTPGLSFNKGIIVLMILFLNNCIKNAIKIKTITRELF